MNPYNYNIRIVNLDFYMCSPIQGLDVMYSEFRGSSVNQVPILRLFGSTETGRKICLHIHGVFPYFYIPYDGVEEVNSLMYQVATNIDKAINISLNQTSSYAQHVYKISLVSGIPMYGYHNKKHQFLKVYLYNPLLIRRVSNLLMNDSMLGKLYQPYETHVPFTLQFMIDYNLHGMSNLILSEIKFRRTTDNMNFNISPELILPAGIKKLSVCEVEGDAFAEHILNRLEVASGDIGVNPGIAALWADEEQRRRNKGETSQIEHLLELKNLNVEPTKSHSIFKQALLDRMAITSTEKYMAVEKLNISVYPAETPENLNIQNASLTYSQCPSSLELSLDNTLVTVGVNDTIIATQSDNFSETLDEEAHNLLRILQNLEANVKDNVEEDSILSQVIKDGEEDKDIDLSMPLESFTTPKKIISNKEDSDDEDLLNTTFIPQLDGECDNESEDYSQQLMINNAYNKRITRSFIKLLNDISIERQTMKEQKSIKKVLYVKLIRIDVCVKKGRDMPLLDADIDITENTNVPSFSFKKTFAKVENVNDIKIVNTNAVEDIVIKDMKCEMLHKKGERRVYKKRKHKNEIMLNKRIKEVKSWHFQIKRTKRRFQLIRLMRKIRENENKISVLLSKNCKPTFNVIPGVRRKARKPYKINILSEIMLNTKNHVDPDLHLILEYPSKENYLYIYNKNIYPEVTKIPNRFMKIGRERTLKNFINKKSVQPNNGDNNNLDKVSQQNCKIPMIDTEHTIHINLKKLQIKDTTDSQMLFSREVIDSENEKHCYIFSSKYLTNISNNNMIHNINSQSINHMQKALEHIKRELEKHVSRLNEPICKQRTIFAKGEYNGSICDGNLNPENHIFKESNEETEAKLSNFDEKLNCSNVAEHDKKCKGRRYYKTRNGNKVKNLQKTFYISCNQKDPVCQNLVTEDVKEKHGNRNINICPEKDQKIKINNSNTSPKTCLFLDGTVDSSSSDEDNSSTLKHKRSTRRPSNFLGYSKLPVTVLGSPSLRNQEHSSCRLVSQSAIKNCEEKKTSVNKHDSQQTTCDNNVKRRLSFVSASLQTTMMEEKLMCNYSPIKIQENVKFALDCDKNKQQEIELPWQIKEANNIKISNEYVVDENFKNSYKDNPQIECDTHIDKKHMDVDGHIENTCTHNRNFYDNIRNELSNDSTSHVNMDYSDSSHCDIFSKNDNDDQVDVSFFKSPEIAKELNSMLTAAQKYDNETNFDAKEGTSKVITPQSSIGSQKSCEGPHHSSGSSSFGLLTPYQRVAEETIRLDTIMENQEKPDFMNNQNEDLHINFSPTVIKTNCDIIPSKVLTPAKKAPTKRQVISSLDKYNIPSVKQDVPFYSNVEDVTGSVEVGYNVLRVISKSSAHLAEFESQTDSINNFRKFKLQSTSSSLEFKKSNANNLMLSFCKDKDCIIVPLKKPPSTTAVKNWIREKSKKTITPKKKPEKIKIFIPLSPDNNGDDEDNGLNMSLTISPCTPINSQSDSSLSLKSSQTPKSSKMTDDSSSTLGDECKTKQKRMKTSHSLRKSLFVSQDKSGSNISCQITGVSPNNTYGFDNSTQNLQAARAVIEHQHLTLLVMELHIRTRGESKPNPEYDPICAIFYSILNDVPSNHPKTSKCKGIIAINSVPVSATLCDVPLLDGAGIDCNITYVDMEENLLNEFLKLVEYWDPDIFAGYEIQMLSWGYLIDRASVLGKNYKYVLSRTKEDKKSKDEDGLNELQITGRIILDVWRLMRHEVALQSYTFESIVYHILHKRVPQYTFKDLSFWWDHRSTLHRYRTVHYYLFRVETILELFDKLDIIGRTSELARLFGIQFFEVLSRGSQFRVESMMLRLAKPLNFIPVSPSVQQRALMKAPEYIPLILEPESRLYNDPVIVLDFQSLYPSIIIAYNYCFTTCLGRVEYLGKNTPFEFGACQLKVSRRHLEKLLKKDLVNFSPCGVCFVKKEVRDGILPRMLREILDTRLMVKNSMKENKGDQLLQKVLHSRQLGLKLIANVTYGYTAANFSGRMPSVEVGDSVVSKGRETLQRAIEMVDGTPEWGARVVYGDTDSLFVMVPGKSRQHAFEIGKKIADAVTKANPDPIKLKLEKVYQPCILQTKKRYVGYMYESPDQKDPVYDAKGIETVRRDGCPAVSKMLEKCLRLLFETKDVSLVKKYVLRQFNKIIAGRTSIQDLTFAKEYRGVSGYRPGACVPSLELARKWSAIDKRNEPRRGERVPYIIINGPPGLPLIRLVRSPRDLLSDPSLRPNALYYITKVIIPPINRCFNLIGVDLNIWFSQMPRKQIQTLPNSVSPGKKSTISQYFSTTSCVACGEQTQTGICDICISKPQTTSITLTEKLRGWERNYYNCNLICQSCTRSPTDIKCVSLDCPVLYRRIQTNRDVQQTSYIRELMASKEFLF